MRSVAICGSIRFRKEIAEWVAHLTNLGVTVYAPDFDWVDAVDKTLAEIPEAERLENEHYKLIVQAEALTYLWVNIAPADVVFILNLDEKGHIGNNTRGEVFFSHAFHKPVYAFARDEEEPTTDRLIKDVAKTPQDLISFLE